jgi:hypothetical protein
MKLLGRDNGIENEYRVYEAMKEEEEEEEKGK